MSWKTTVTGILMILTAVITVVMGLIDADPVTPNFQIAAAEAMAGIGLLMARDNDKSSEDVKAGG